MPTIKLIEEEQVQWTGGDKNLTSTMLLNVMIFLQNTTTKTVKKPIPPGKLIIRQGVTQEDHYISDDGVDVTAFYQRVNENILELFDKQGRSRLVSSTLKIDERLPVDYSALLGAYFRSKAKYPDGESIVTLNDDQLNAVYKFVEPLIVGKMNAHGEPLSAKEYLDSFSKTPKDNHREVITALIFNGISEEQRKQMFKAKYAKAPDDLLTTVINAVEFMRTPFSVLSAEEEAAKQVAKLQEVNDVKAYKLAKELADEAVRTGKPPVVLPRPPGDVAPKVSPLDLQWTQLMSGMKRAVDNVLQHKKDKDNLKTDAETAKDHLLAVIPKCNGSFGIANAEHILGLKFAKKNKAFLESLGGPGSTQESTAEYIAALRANVLSGAPGTLTKELVDKMSLTILVSTLVEQWKIAHDAAMTQVVSLQKELATKTAAIRELETQLAPLKQQVIESEAQLSLAQAANEDLKRELQASRSQVASLTSKVAEQETTIIGLAAKNKELQAQLDASGEILEEDSDKRVARLHEENQELRAAAALQVEVVTGFKAELVTARDAVNLPPSESGRGLDSLSGGPARSEQSRLLKEAFLDALRTLDREAARPDDKLEKYIKYNFSVIDSLSDSDLKAIKGKVEQLTVIMSAVNIIVKTLKAGDLLFNTGENKAKRIEGALRGIGIEDRLKLVALDSKKNSKEASTEYPECSSLIEALSSQRALIFKSSEAASFRLFKSQMKPTQSSELTSEPPTISLKD